MLQVRVADSQRRQDGIEIVVSVRSAQAIACGRQRRIDRGGRLRQVLMVGQRPAGCARPADAVHRFLEQRLGGVQDRVIGCRAFCARGRQYQQSGELGGHLTQVFEMRASGEHVGDGEIVERVGHGNGLYRQKGWKLFSPQPFALCPDAGLKGPRYVLPSLEPLASSL